MLDSQLRRVRGVSKNATQEHTRRSKTCTMHTRGCVRVTPPNARPPFARTPSPRSDRAHEPLYARAQMHAHETPNARLDCAHALRRAHPPKRAYLLARANLRACILRAYPLW